MRRTLRTRELFAAIAVAGEDEQHDLMTTVVDLHLDLAHGLAARYHSRGVPLEDLRQVAALALVKATRRYDVTTGFDFDSFAVPTIRGELRRYFRDHGWMIRPPRRIQDLQARINSESPSLTQRLGRAPKPSEIADHLDTDPSAVNEALACEGYFAPTSLDLPLGSMSSMTMGDLLGSAESGYLSAENRLVLRRALADLTADERQLLNMRYVEELTQTEIGARLHVSQVQASRRLARILNQLRRTIG
jgi:RNA polymerase sigma-B factor